MKKYDIKQLDIAVKLGIHPNHLRRWDNLKDRTINAVILIHKLTNIPYIELIGEELKD